MPSSDCPSARLRTSSGSTASPSPVATASTSGKRRSSSSPVSPRQLAPPKTTKASGSARLHALGQRQRGRGLVEHAREADDGRLECRHLRQAALEEPIHTAPHIGKLAAQRIREGHLAEERHVVLAQPAREDVALVLFRPARRWSRDRPREDPVAKEVLGLPRRDEVVGVGADRLGEGKRRIDDSHALAHRGERCLQQSERKRRLPEARERHRDQHRRRPPRRVAACGVPRLPPHGASTRSAIAPSTRRRS